MSRSLGLREDQRWGEMLVTRILQSLPDEPRRVTRRLTPLRDFQKEDHMWELVHRDQKQNDRY